MSDDGVRGHSGRGQGRRMRGRMVGVRERGREGVPGRQCECLLNRRSSTQSPLGSAFHCQPTCWVPLTPSPCPLHLSGFYV